MGLIMWRLIVVLAMCIPVAMIVVAVHLPFWVPSIIDKNAWYYIPAGASALVVAIFIFALAGALLSDFRKYWE